MAGCTSRDSDKKRYENFQQKPSDNIKLRNAFTVGIADEAILNEDGKINPEKLNAISYDPANRTYLRVGGKAGTVFSDGNQLK